MRTMVVIVLLLLLFGLDVVILTSQNVRLNSIAFYSDAEDVKIAVSFRDSQEIQIYVNGALTETLVESHPDATRILDLDWNSTGDRLAAAVGSRIEANDYWSVWDVNTQQRILTGKVGGGYFVAWHPIDPDRLIAASGVTFVDVDVAQSAITVSPREHPNIAQIAWSPTGEYLTILEDYAGVFVLGEADLSVAFQITDYAALSDRGDWYYRFAWSPDGTQFALYDILDTEIEIWNTATVTREATFPSFAPEPEHAEGILWTPAGLVGYIGTNDIALYDPATGEVINIINVERSALFWDEPRQRFVYTPESSDGAITLEVLPLISTDEVPK